MFEPERLHLTQDPKRAIVTASDPEIIMVSPFDDAVCFHDGTCWNQGKRLQNFFEKKMVNAGG
jgi:hypothetical protein